MDPSVLFILFFVLFAVLAILSLVLENRRQQRRTQAIQQLAIEMGAQFQETDMAFFEALMRARFQLFDHGRSRRLRNIFRRSDQAGSVTVFDYIYVTGSGKHRHTHYQTVALLSFERPNLPEFVLRPQGLLDNLAAKFGKHDINIESHAEFSRRYHLSSSDEYATRAIFRPSLLDYLERQPKPLVIESNGSQVLTYCQHQVVEADGLRGFVEDARQLAGLIRSGYENSM